MKKTADIKQRRLNGCEFSIPDCLEKDVDELFHYDKEIRHQVRCHDYCGRRSILRDHKTPATLAAVRDLVGRAYNSGRSDMANELALQSKHSA